MQLQKSSGFQPKNLNSQVEGHCQEILPFHNKKVAKFSGFEKFQNFFFQKFKF